MTRWLLRSSFATALLLLTIWTALADLSNLDPTARITLSRLRAGETAQGIENEGRLSVSALGDLDVFVIGDVTREQLEAAGARVRTAVPGVFIAWIAQDRVVASVLMAPAVERAAGVAPIRL
jgi:hypothetical protein